jgi:hypothetical protein
MVLLSEFFVMPTMRESGEPESAVDKNTKEQYEALGRFIVAFEEMVNDVRELCTFILGGFDLNLQKFVSVALHHQSLTAKPLLEILRALIAEVLQVETEREKYKMDDESRSIIIGVLGPINNEYNHLTNLRNELVHGTWFVGFGGARDRESKEFFVRKLRAKASGLIQSELPKTASQLNALTQRCQNVHFWMLSLTTAFLVDDGGESVKTNFWYNKEQGKWSIRTSTGDETLP